MKFGIKISLFWSFCLGHPCRSHCISEVSVLWQRPDCPCSCRPGEVSWACLSSPGGSSSGPPPPQHLQDTTSKLHFRELQYRKLQFRKLQYRKLQYRKLQFRKLQYRKLQKSKLLYTTRKLQQSILNWRAVKYQNQETGSRKY